MPRPNAPTTWVTRANSLPRPLCTSPGPVSLVGEGLRMTEEFSEIKGQLNVLAQGQAQLQSAIDKVQLGLDALIGTSDQPLLDAAGKSVSLSAGKVEETLQQESPDGENSVADRFDEQHRDSGLPQKAISAWGSQSKGDIVKLLSFNSPDLLPSPTHRTPQSVDGIGPSKTSIKRYHLSSLTGLTEHELRTLLQINRKQHLLQRQQSHDVRQSIGEALGSVRLVRKATKGLDARKAEVVLDSLIGVVVVANAICVGIGMDLGAIYPASWLALDVIFTLIFISELTGKIYVHGFCEQFCGKGSIFNVFDASLILADVVQLVLLLSLSDSPRAQSSFSASALRVVRLLRLSRSLRLLRSRVFENLVAMIHGMLGGLATLGWAVMLFLLFIYMVALVFRQFIGLNGEGNDDAAAWYFRSVPRSMFTIFRCSFGDCSTINGTPIFEHVSKDHGAFWCFVYSAFLFLVVIGLFNVISAIFVENTMASAAKIASKKRKAKLENEARWAVNVVAVLTSLLQEYDSNLPGLEKLLETGEYEEDLLSAIISMEFPQYVLDKVVLNDACAQRALTQLDIDPADHRYLSDILDPHNRGSIGVVELVEGLKRLRGGPRRSDIISVDLMVRSLQRKVDDIGRWLDVQARRRSLDIRCGFSDCTDQQGSR